MEPSPGLRFRMLVKSSSPLQVLGTINAYSAMLAESTGGKAIYLSGAGVANASYGLPDLGMTSLENVLTDARRITEVTDLPLLVDVDTGFGNALGIARTIQSLERAFVAAVHIEDQVTSKRCGHRPNKTIVSMHEMGDRIKAAVDARVSSDFVIMARTDAYAIEGKQAALDRALYYVEQGADMIFPEALSTLDEYRFFTTALDAPVLANMTEFGLTPLFTRDALSQAGVGLILYPLSAFRAMSFAALGVYRSILNEGTQQSMLSSMQIRDELYDILKYREFEKKVDQLMEEGDGNK